MFEVFINICNQLNRQPFSGQDRGMDLMGLPTDFWEYNPATDIWTQKANIPALMFLDYGYFSIGNYGYITCGETGVANQYSTILWQYIPATDQWVTKTSFPGASRDEPASFSIGNHGYVGWGGKNGIPQYNDFWEYTPDSSEMISVNEITDYNIVTTVFPSPFNNKLTIQSTTSEPCELILYDISSRKLMQQTFTNTTTLNTEALAKGMYMYEVRNKKGIVKNGKVIME